MLLFLLAYAGGILTILSPCILPVLPFVFARADRPFLTNGLPMLAGMALAFSLIATLAAVGGGWAIAANQWGRWLALFLLAAFALLLIFPQLSSRAMAPLVRLGDRMGARADRGSGLGASLGLGVATGLLWAPCAGPILGLILAGAALGGANASTVLLLLAYALGAATSLAAALLVGGRLFAVMKRSIGAGERVRQALGILVLAGVAAIALGFDTRVLAKLSSAQTFNVENRLAALAGMPQRPLSTEYRGRLPDEGALPPLDGAVQWLNGPPLTREQLRGKVVLIDFWTYSCINCLRSLPYVRAWADRYRQDGLVVIGVHTPEFAFERDVANVRKAVTDLGIAYPVAIDNDRRLWTAFANRYWPAHYLADASGRLRYHHFGEGRTDETEAAIRALLREAGAAPAMARARVRAVGAAAGADFAAKQSPETYVGTARAANFASPGGWVADPHRYALPPRLALNQWGLEGQWQSAPDRARLLAAPGTIAFRYRARDLHLVLGSPGDRPIRYRITIDGAAPGDDHGVDSDGAGGGMVRDHRLYQLVRHRGPVRERLFRITFLDPGVEAYAFTFG